MGWGAVAWWRQPTAKEPLGAEAEAEGAEVQGPVLWQQATSERAGDGQELLRGTHEKVELALFGGSNAGSHRGRGQSVHSCQCAVKTCGASWRSGNW